MPEAMNKSLTAQQIKDELAELTARLRQLAEGKAKWPRYAHPLLTWALSRRAQRLTAQLELGYHA